MGGFASVLGHVAGGFEQARQQDYARQFADEQNRRAMVGELLQKIALNPVEHPDVRQAAGADYLQLGQTPFKLGKPLDFGNAMSNTMETLAKVRAAGQQQQPTQTTTSFQAPGGPMLAPGQQSPTGGVGGSRTIPSIGMPPLPPGIAGPPQAPSAPVNVPLSQSRVDLGTSAQFTPPPAPPAWLAGPSEYAQAAGQEAGATAGGTLAGQMGERELWLHNLVQQYPQLAKDQNFLSMLPSLTISGNVPYILGRGMMAGPSTNMTVHDALADPTLAPLVPPNLRNSPNTTVKLTRDELNRPISITAELIPSTLPHTTSGATTTPGGLTTTHGQTVTPVLPGGGPPPPPRYGAGGMAANKVAPAVDSAMQNIQLYGEPEGKLSDAQSIAVSQLRAQGIDPTVMATMSTRTMGDKARAILPLIQHARELIAADPEALGPLAGRWSELQNKAGDLSGPPKELAGTLVSIYSIAGGMHGWRSLQVANEFEKAYGDLSNNPASLNSGLDALQGTASTLIKTAYPGMKGAPPPSTTEGKKSINWDAHPIIQ